MENTGITKQQRPQELRWLTILRYPAAVWVVALHSLSQINELRRAPLIADSFLKAVIDRGFLGVSFFFMLSGFILAWNHPVITDRPRYAVTRAARILPVYYLSLAFSLPLFLSGLSTYGGRAAALFKGSAALLLVQSWFPPIAGVWNIPAWTLSCEMFFYALLPFLLPALHSFVKSFRIRGILGLLTVLFFAGLIMPAVFDHMFHCPRYVTDFSLNVLWGKEVKIKLFIEKFPLLRCVDFIAGVVLCVWLRPMLTKSQRPVSRPFASGLIACGVLWIATSALLPFVYSFGTWCLPGFGAVIAGFALLSLSGGESRFSQYGKLLGGASYSLYLLHMPAIKYLSQNYRQHFAGSGTLPGMSDFWTFFGLILVLMTAVSVAVFMFYEEPLRRWGMRAWQLRRTESASFDLRPEPEAAR
ncbi:MAG: acyltransferase [Chthoniobacter sp.]|nr:acyltransferase [Chthoniobacter sp.]